MPKRYRVVLEVECGFEASQVRSDWVHRVLQPALGEYGVTLQVTQVEPLPAQ